jgi:hypothetical protein
LEDEVLPIDWVRWDKNLPKGLLLAVGEYYSSLAKIKGASEETCTAIKNLFRVIITLKKEIGHFIVDFHCMASGLPGTTPINGIANMLLTCVLTAVQETNNFSVTHCKESKNVYLGCLNELAPLNLLNQIERTYTCGDDVLYGITEDARGFWSNPETTREVFEMTHKAFGLTATNDAKDGPPCPVLKENCSFMGRGFVETTVNGERVVLAPLRLTSLLNMGSHKRPNVDVAEFARSLAMCGGLESAIHCHYSEDPRMKELFKAFIQLSDIDYDESGVMLSDFYSGELDIEAEENYTICGKESEPSRVGLPSATPVQEQRRGPSSAPKATPTQTPANGGVVSSTLNTVSRVTGLASNFAASLGLSKPAIPSLPEPIAVPFHNQAKPHAPIDTNALGSSDAEVYSVLPNVDETSIASLGERIDWLYSVDVPLDGIKGENLLIDRVISPGVAHYETSGTDFIITHTTSSLAASLARNVSYDSIQFHLFCSPGVLASGRICLGFTAGDSTPDLLDPNNFATITAKLVMDLSKETYATVSVPYTSQYPTFRNGPYSTGSGWGPPSRSKAAAGSIRVQILQDCVTTTGASGTAEMLVGVSYTGLRCYGIANTMLQGYVAAGIEDPTLESQPLTTIAATPIAYPEEWRLPRFQDEILLENVNDRRVLVQSISVTNSQITTIHLDDLIGTTGIEMINVALAYHSLATYDSITYEVEVLGSSNAAGMVRACLVPAFTTKDLDALEPTDYRVIGFYPHVIIPISGPHKAQLISQYCGPVAYFRVNAAESETADRNLVGWALQVHMDDGLLFDGTAVKYSVNIYASFQGLRVAVPVPYLAAGVEDQEDGVFAANVSQLETGIGRETQEVSVGQREVALHLREVIFGDQISDLRSLSMSMGFYPKSPDTDITLGQRRGVSFDVRADLIQRIPTFVALACPMVFILQFFTFRRGSTNFAISTNPLIESKLPQYALMRQNPLMLFSEHDSYFAETTSLGYIPSLQTGVAMSNPRLNTILTTTLPPWTGDTWSYVSRSSTGTSNPVRVQAPGIRATWWYGDLSSEAQPPVVMMVGCGDNVSLYGLRHARVRVSQSSWSSEAARIRGENFVTP